MKVSIFPSLDLVASDVGIALPEQGGAAEFATAGTLRFGLVLRSLLAGKMELTEVTLSDPVITLPLPEAAAPPPAEPAEEGSAPRRNLSIRALLVRNGTLIMPGENGEPGKRITALDAEASLPTANGPLSFDAAARYDGEPFTAEGTIGSFTHFLDGGPVPVKLAVESSDLPERATLTAAVSYRDDVLKVAQFQAKSGSHTISGNAVYRDDTLTVSEGVFDGVPFAGSAHLAGDTLTLNGEVADEATTLRLAGSLGEFDEFLAGEASPIELNIVAPDYLEEEGKLNGVISFKDETLSLPEFTAVSGKDTVSGAALYKDGALSLNQATAKIGDSTISGDATYRDDTVELDITFDPEGKPARVTGSVAGIEKLLDGKPATVNLEIASPSRLSAKAVVTGDAAYKNDGLVLTGFTAVSGDYTVTGDGTYRDEVLVLDPFEARTSGQIVSGALNANLAGDIPSLTGTLTATGAVKPEAANAPAPGQNLQAAEPATETKPSPVPLATPVGPLAQRPDAGVGNAGAPPTKPEGAPNPQETRQPAPAARSAEAPPTGSGAESGVKKLGLSALNDVNADLTVTFNQFVFDDVEIGSATVKAVLSGGKLTAETVDLKAYGGGGSVTFVLDASSEVPSHRLNLALSGLDAYPFLGDVADFHTIEGKAAIGLDLTASGNSGRAIESSLNGTAKFEFTDGALRGLNVASMLRNLTTGILTGWQYKQETKTLFAKFSASFQIENGQAQTKDLRLLGPLVSIGGTGKVDIPGERLKFRVNPFMLASVESQSGKSNMLGFPVPIAVSGPWDNPSIYPDIVGVLENPVAAYQQLNKLGGGLIAVPATILGIDTGEGGLVEKSIAIPEAMTKGVVGGIGQMLGVKQAEDAAATPPVPADQVGDTIPRETEAAPQQPAAAAAQKSKPESVPTDNRTFQGSFGQ